MKTIFQNSLKKTFFVLACLSITTLTNIKAQSTKPPYPKMYVPKSDGKARKKWFTSVTPAAKKSKHTHLKELLGLGRANSITCSIDDLTEFIDALKEEIKGIRFYFAVYNKDSAEGVPGGFDKHLTLILSPCKDIDSIGKDYYNIRPNGAIRKITDRQKEGWINYYEDRVLPAFNNTIDGINIEDNRDRFNTKYSDTKSIFYDLEDFKEFLYTEREIQAKKRNIMTGIQIDYCSYTNNGFKGNCDNRYRFKNRLIIQFEYTKKSSDGLNNYEVFYIDEEGRKIQETSDCGEELEGAKRKGFFNSADNGQLCPANCPR